MTSFAPPPTRAAHYISITCVVFGATPRSRLERTGATAMRDWAQPVARHYLPRRDLGCSPIPAPSAVFWPHFQWPDRSPGLGTRFVSVHGGKRSRAWEQFCCSAVATAAVVAFRVGSGPRRLGWEAFDEEGMRCGRILEKLPRRANRSVGARRSSLVAAPQAHGLASRDAARRDDVANSFLFSTRLCENESTAQLQLHAEPFVTNDCSAKGLE